MTILAPAHPGALVDGATQPDGLPWAAADPLDDATFADVRRRAIVDCCKWDPQMEDESAIARAPIILRRDAWDTLRALAESLAREAQAAEAELAMRAGLQRRLSIPRRIRRALAEGAPSEGMARLVRFDFHWTTDGWRISEANTDVPGGLNEASGFPSLFAPHYEGTEGAGDVVARYADAIVGRLSEGARVALVHATAYVDDRQVMAYLGSALEERGARSLLASPAHIRWREGRAFLDGTEKADALDAVVRFFPAEWLPDLPAPAAWAHWFRGARTPMSNPAAALLTQSKRFPLAWDALDRSMPTWRRLLPETRDPRECDWRGGDWVLKPAFGRVGEDIGMRDVSTPREWSAIARSAWLRPRQWAAQRRFVPVAMQTANGPMFPCIGVYTIDGRAVGAYGRIARRPLIDWRAQDAAVLVLDGYQEPEAG